MPGSDSLLWMVTDYISRNILPYNGQIYVVIVSAENQETSCPTNCLCVILQFFNYIFLISENSVYRNYYCFFPFFRYPFLLPDLSY